jgi:putative lipoprotein (rSAM/lipoprotein system)
MKTVKKRVLRGWNLVIAWVLSLFGVACLPIACEYGTPEAKFIVKGTITSEETQSPVSQIRVIMGRDTAYSDPTGKYEVSTFDYPDSQVFNVNYSDTDGATNGTYSPQDTLIPFENPEFHNGSGSWYKGETEKVVNIKLK